MKLNDGYSRLFMAAITSAIICIIAVAILAPSRLGILVVLKEWQDLLSGALTLLAAGYAANFVVAQMRHAQSIEDDRLARARRAWLATMPETMSAVCGFTQVSYNSLVAQHAIAIRPQGLTAALNPVPAAPSLADQVLTDVRSMIEVAHDLEADGYITLLSDIQVHRVRWGDRLERLENGHNLIARELENEMVEAAELYGRAVNLLGVARPNPSAFDKTPSSRLSSLGVLSDQRQPIASVAELARSRDATDPLTVP